MTGIYAETGFWLLEIIMDEMENEDTERYVVCVSGGSLLTYVSGAHTAASFKTA